MLQINYNVKHEMCFIFITFRRFVLKLYVILQYICLEQFIGQVSVLWHNVLFYTEKLVNFQNTIHSIFFVRRLPGQFQGQGPADNNANSWQQKGWGFVKNAPHWLWFVSHEVFSMTTRRWVDKMYPLSTVARPWAKNTNLGQTRSLCPKEKT